MAFDVSPPRDCGACSRLAAYRAANRAAYPDWSNAPVESFGEADARLLIVGLAPGLRGANRTGRPFTGDYAGDLLYETLIRFGFAAGCYGRRPDDGLELVDCAIVNAVRCAPPQNKPTPQEIAACRAYLSQSIAALANLRVVLALGRVAHDTVLRAFGARAASFPVRAWRASRAEGGRTEPVRQLSLLALQYQHGRADQRDVPATFSPRSGPISSGPEMRCGATLSKGKIDVSPRVFGAIDGVPAIEVVIASRAGASAKILTWGAVIRDLVVPTAEARRA